MNIDDDIAQEAKTTIDKLKERMKSVDKESKTYKDVQHIYENSKNDREIMIKLLAYRMSIKGKYT